MLGPRDGRARAATEVLAELDWVMDRAVEHLGADRAARWLRKVYPWYVERLDAPRHCSRPCSDGRRAEARAVLDGANALAAAA